eukprot:1238781-Amorphochlora_amoeboformis.AAC.1
MSWSITNRNKFATRKYVTGEWIKPGAKVWEILLIFSRLLTLLAVVVSQIDLKDPAKVAPTEEEVDEPSVSRKKKKKDKKKKKHKKKVHDDEDVDPFDSVPAPVEEKAPKAAAATSNGGLPDIFNILSVDETPAPEAKTQPKAQSKAEAKVLVDEKATNNILAMFDESPAPARSAPMGSQGFYGGGMGGGVGGGGGGAMASGNPFLQGGPAPAQGNPFAGGGGGYGVQPGYGGYPAQGYGGYPQQNQGFNQQQMWRQQQQSAAINQQNRAIQQQKVQTTTSRQLSTMATRRRSTLCKHKRNVI